MIFDSYFRNLLSISEVGLSIDSNFRIAFGIIVVTHIVNHSLAIPPSSFRGEKELRNIISTRERGQKGFNRGCA